MKITADTNVLVRAVTNDDAKSKAAQAALRDAEVAVALPALCELVRVLAQDYKVPSPEIARAIRGLLNAENVVVNRTAAEAGWPYSSQGVTSRPAGVIAARSAAFAAKGPHGTESRVRAAAGRAPQGGR